MMIVVKVLRVTRPRACSNNARATCFMIYCITLYDIDIVCVLFPAIARARIKNDMRGNGLSRRYPKISKIILPHTFSIKLLTLITLILIIIS